MLTLACFLCMILKRFGDQLYLYRHFKDGPLKNARKEVVIVILKKIIVDSYDINALLRAYNDFFKVPINNFLSEKIKTWINSLKNIREEIGAILLSARR